jgi:hypothetical protein
MWKKLRNMIADSCDLLELLMGVIVLLATISESSNIFISDDEWDAFKKKHKEHREKVFKKQ